MAKKSKERFEHIHEFSDWSRAFIDQYGNSELGERLHEYVSESVHGGFDGFTSADLTGIRRFLSDFAIFTDAYHK